MGNVAQLVIVEVWALIFALFAVVAVQLVTGQIDSTGLLRKKEGDGSISPERIQLLLATFAAASQYLAQVIKTPTHFPEVSQNLLLLLGGSHALYLGRRFYVTQRDKDKSK